MYNKLRQEFKHYLSNQDELVKKYNGKYVVIKNKTVIKAYDQESVAISNTSKKYKLGTFLVQKCESGSENYTQTYNSRVKFV